MDEKKFAEGGSTLVQSGKVALTFTDMAAFVNDIKARPTERLINDLAGLMALPDAKYQLVVMVLRKKVRPGGAERPALLERLGDLQKHAENPSVRSRARAFIEKLAS